MVKILLSDKRTNMNADDGVDGNALDMAYEQGNPIIIKILRKHGAKSTKKVRSRQVLEDSSDETISDEKPLREYTEDEKSLCKQIMKPSWK